MSNRAVLYARVSGDDRHREGRNLNGQLDMCREYSLSHDYTVVAELSEDDRGASGAAFELEQLDRVREMARAREFDILVTRELDRLSRSLAKQLIVEEELKRYGVRLEYVLGEYPDTPEGMLMKNLKASIAEYERLKITERMVRGRRLKVKTGSVMMHGHVPYGYRLAESDRRWVLQVDETQARVVRMVFQWYTEGDGGNGTMSLRAIARKLSHMGVPTYSDLHPGHARKQRAWGEWESSSIGVIVANEAYSGVWHYGKSAKNPDLLAVNIPAIVDRVSWEAAQARLAHNRSMVRRKSKYDFLLTGRLSCAVCGSNIAGTSRREKNGHVNLYYRCQAGFQYARPCTMRLAFRVDQVDRALWEWVKSFLLNPVGLTEGLALYQAEQERIQAPMRDRIRVVDDLLTDNRQQLGRLLDLYLTGGFARDMLVERKSRLETVIGALERERANLVAHLEAETLTAEQIQALEEFASQVADGLESADQSIDARRQILEILDTHATLAIEDGQKVVYARCALKKESTRLLSANTYTPPLPG